MMVSSFDQAEIMRQMKIERLRAVREQAKIQSLSRTSNYCDNKNQLKRHLQEEKRKENIQNHIKEQQKLEQKLHRVLVDTGTAHDAAHYFTNHELARQKRLEHRTVKLQKKQVKHAQVAQVRLQKEKFLTKEASDQTRRLAKQREEQCLLDRERARLQAESQAARDALLLKSKQREDYIMAQSAHNKHQEFSQQGAISVQQRGKVVVKAHVTRHGKTPVHDSAIVVNQSESFKDSLHKTRKDIMLKELLSQHVIKNRNKQARIATASNNAFSSIEKSFAALSKMDRSHDRRNRVKNIEDVHRRSTQEKDTRLSGGSGRNPAAYQALLRQNFEKDFLETEGTATAVTNMNTARDARGKMVTEHTSFTWEKVLEEGKQPNPAFVDIAMPTVNRKAKTDTGLKKKTISVTPVKKQSKKQPVAHVEQSVPQWNRVNLSSQTLSTGLLGEQTLIPTQVASFLTQEDPYLGVGAHINDSMSSCSTSEVDSLQGANVYEMLEGMARIQVAGSSVTNLSRTELLLQQRDDDATHESTAATTIKSQHIFEEKVKRGGEVEEHDRDIFDFHTMSANIRSENVPSRPYADHDYRSSSGSNSVDDESDKFNYVFEYDAVHGQNLSQPMTSPTFSPRMEYSPAQMLHEPVGDKRVAPITGGGQRKRSDAFPLGNSESQVPPQPYTSQVILDSSTSSSESECKHPPIHHQTLTKRTRFVEDTDGTLLNEVAVEQVGTLEVLELSDDSLRVDPTRYEKYMQEYSGDFSQSGEEFMLDPFSEDERHEVKSGTVPPFSLTITTTPGSLDSDDKILNSFARKSSGSIRHHADFSIDSTDVVLTDDVVTSSKKEQRKLSISSMSTADAYHDVSMGNVMANVSPARQHMRRMTLSPVASVDMRGKHIHAFRSCDDESLSSMSVAPGLDQDSISGFEHDEDIDRSQEVEQHGEVGDEVFDAAGVTKHLVVSDINDDESDAMSHDSMQETFENLIISEVEAPPSTRSSGDGRRSLPFTYSFSSDEDNSGREPWKQDSLSSADKVENDSGHTSASEPNALRWQIPSESMSGSSTNNDEEKSMQFPVSINVRNEQLSSAQPVSAVPKDNFISTTSGVKLSQSNAEGSTTTVSHLFKKVNSSTDDSSVDAGEALIGNNGGDVVNEEYRDDLVDDEIDDANDDASEITMEWETLVNKLNVFSSSHELSGENVSPFSSVDSSALFRSDTDNHSARDYGENYIDNVSDDENDVNEDNSKGGDDDDDGEEDDDEVDFRMTVQGSVSSSSESPLVKYSTTSQNTLRSSEVNITSYRSNVSMRSTSTRHVTTTSESTISSHKATSNVIQSSLDFISKYKLEGIISDDLSSSSSTVPSVSIPASTASSGTYAPSGTRIADIRRVERAGSTGGNHIAASDDISSRLSTGSDAFNLRLSILSSSSAGDEDGTDDAIVAERIIKKHQRVARSSEDIDASMTPGATEVTATVRTSRAVQDLNTWLQEPSFSVNSSNSSDEGWKTELSKSYLSAGAMGMISSQVASSSQRDIVLSSVGSVSASALKSDTDTGDGTDSSSKFKRTVLADMDIFFSDSDSELEGMGVTRSTVSMTVGPMADASEESSDLLGDVSSDSVPMPVYHPRKSVAGSDTNVKPFDLSESEEEEDSTDRILASWTGPKSPDAEKRSASVRERGLLSSSSSGSGSMSDDVDHVQALQKIIGENMNLLDSSSASNSSSSRTGSSSSDNIIHADDDEDEKEGETSLGELLGFSDNSSFSLPDDMS